MSPRTLGASIPSSSLDTIINGSAVTCQIIVNEETYLINQLEKIFINPLAHESNKHLISPYDISPESHVKVTRVKETSPSPTKEALDRSTNSPCQHLRKCMEDRMENKKTDVKD